MKIDNIKDEFGWAAPSEQEFYMSQTNFKLQTPSKGLTSASKAAPGWRGRVCLGDTGDRIACSQDQLPVINRKAHPYVPRILRKFGPRVIRYTRTVAVVCQHSILSINPYSVNTGINVLLLLIIGFSRKQRVSVGTSSLGSCSRQNLGVMILSGRKENLQVTIIVDGSWCAGTQPSGYVIS